MRLARSIHETWRNGSWNMKKRQHTRGEAREREEGRGRIERDIKRDKERGKEKDRAGQRQREVA
jgi:hypothetical protein